MSEAKVVRYLSNGRANYGLDAPAVVRNLFVVAAAGFLAWSFGAAFEIVLWSQSSEPFRVIFPLNYMAPWIGAGCLVMGCWMIYYSYMGKLNMREALLNGVPWRGDETVLDVGCGRGLMLIGAAKRLTTGTATGIDLWQNEDLAGNSPQATRANAEAEGVGDRVMVQTGDARKLPFPDASFDVMVSSAALHNIYVADERRAAVREIARVLKPGGTAILADIRHTFEYAGVLQEQGFARVRHNGSNASSLVAKVMTFGALRPGAIIAEKARA